LKMKYIFKWLLLSLAGCTSQQLYNTDQSYQRNACFNMPDQNAGSDCLNKANMSYDKYKYEAGTTK